MVGRFASKPAHNADSTTRRFAAALGLAIFATLPARAAIAPASTMNPDLPPTLRHGNVTYMSGGISRAQAAVIKRMARDYPLELHFLESGPAYGVPVYVPVTIKNRTGRTILDTTADGPFMLAKLPDGAYTVSAEHDGRVERLAANLAHGKHATLAFDWKG
jgi:hypothetical protein